MVDLCSQTDDLQDLLELPKVHTKSNHGLPLFLLTCVHKLHLSIKTLPLMTLRIPKR